jgi:Leucine-rich repeat (LRR) protein
MKNLKKLNLNDNKISKIDDICFESLKEIGMIEDLNLSSNKLIKISAKIGLLSTLKYLNLNNNELTELPVEITNLTFLYNSQDAFSIKGNKLIKPQQDIAQRGGLKWIKVYFEMLNLKNRSDINSYVEIYYKYIMKQLYAEKVLTKHNLNKKRYQAKSMQIKLLVVGHPNAGKTSLVNCLRNVNNNNKDNITTTV